jgi:hypothetical protein
MAGARLSCPESPCYRWQHFLVSSDPARAEERDQFRGQLRQLLVRVRELEAQAPGSASGRLSSAQAQDRPESRITVVPVSPALGRHAGELLGATGLPGRRCSVDAVVAATALERERPVVVLTGDPVDLNRLVEEPGRPKAQRITAIHV